MTTLSSKKTEILCQPKFLNKINDKPKKSRVTPITPIENRMPEVILPTTKELYEGCKKLAEHYYQYVFYWEELGEETKFFYQKMLDKYQFMLRNIEWYHLPKGTKTLPVKVLVHHSLANRNEDLFPFTGENPEDWIFKIELYIDIGFGNKAAHQIHSFKSEDGLDTYQTQIKRRKQ